MVTHVVEAGVRDQEYVGLRCRLERGQHATGPGREDVDHLRGPVGHAVQPEPVQPVDGPFAPLRGEVATLREDHERVVLVEVAGQVADLGLEVAALAPVGGDEPARQPGEQHPERRVPGEHLLEHDPRLAAVPVHQRVHQREGVPRAGVPAEHQQRLAGVGVRGGPDGLDLQAQHPPGLAEEHHEVGLHQVVVDPLEERVADEDPEARGDPEPEQLHQDDALQGQVHHPEPQQAHRSQPARDERRDDVAAHQPQRQRRPEQHGHHDEQRRDHGPLQDDRDHVAHQRCSAR